MATAPDGRQQAWLRTAGLAARDLAMEIEQTRVLYPRADLAGPGRGPDPFAQLGVTATFGMVGLPAPGWSARSRCHGFAINALLYCARLPGRQLIYASNLVVWRWLRKLARRRRLRYALELPAGQPTGPGWLGAARRADFVVCHDDNQFDQMISVGLAGQQLFLAADRQALVRAVISIDSN